jgi:signal peptidase
VSAVAVPTPRSARWADRGLSAVIAGLLALLVIGVALRATGTTAMVDYTDSMRPAISAGDVVVDRPVRAADLHRGEVATIADAATHRTVTHRVVSVTRTGATVTVVTRGDANDASERWVLPAGASVRHVVARIPWIGHVMAWLASPLLRALLLALGAFAALAWGINRLRRA